MLRTGFQLWDIQPLSSPPPPSPLPLPLPPPPLPQQILEEQQLRQDLQLQLFQSEQKLKRLQGMGASHVTNGPSTDCDNLDISPSMCLFVCLFGHVLMVCFSAMPTSPGA